MMFTPKRVPSTSLTVSETPSSATAPFPAMKRASAAERGRALQIDAPPRLPGAERGAGQGLVGGLDGEDGALALGLAHRDDGQAATVAGDRRPLLEASALVGAGDHETCALPLKKRSYAAGNASEHRPTRRHHVIRSDPNERASSLVKCPLAVTRSSPSRPTGMPPPPPAAFRP